ncbi:Ig-like domain-containing protein [Scandinavium goeteborgense]|uniref:Ig-like protein group 3 n=1 Tax=Scandinavium goeteborgense TaxID=1851514 RepID=A0A4R6DQJ4_SCAGO|nr:Ig-like domain-containing protein [Scandinavium goeteborgense]TDN46824.1 Ig-like protein group 3 [Scandinavium goeteborgense]
MSDSARNNALLAAQLASLPTDNNGGLIPTPAEPGVVHIDFANDNQGQHTGDIGQFGYTDDLTPTIGGIQEDFTAGLKVTIFCNTQPIGTAIVGNDGHWSFTPDMPLEPNHEYIFNTVITDSGTRDFLISLPYTLYTTEHNGDLPPDITLDSVVDNVKGYNGFTGALHDGDLTNDNRPALSGHANAGARVNIYDNGELIGTTTANSKGGWTYTPAALRDGEHYLSASVYTAAGESHRSASFGITVDTHVEKPFIETVTDNAGLYTGLVANGGATDDSRPVLRGHAEAGAQVDIHVFGPDGKELYYHSVTAGTDGSWTYQPNTFPTHGKYSFGISSVDQAGNAWRDYGNKFTVDYVGSNQDIDRPDAPIIIVFHEDATHVGDLTNGKTTDDTTPELIGLAEANSVVKIYEGSNLLGSVTADKFGDWNFTPTALNDGKHTFTATATDAAGQTSEHSGNFVINIDVTDTTAPAVPVIDVYHDNAGASSGDFKSGTTTDDTTPTLYGHAEAGSTVKVYEGSKLLGSVTADKDGDWNFTPSARSEGKHTFTATATDAAGNVSGHSGNFVINIDVPDTVAPDAPVITGVYDDVGTQYGPVANGGKTDDSQPLISGTAEAGSIVTLKRLGPSYGNYVVGSAKADSNGHWAIQTQNNRGHLGNHGHYTYTATAKDAAGNISDASNHYVVDFVGSNQDDTTTPDAPTITNAYDNVGPVTGDQLFSNGTTDDTTPELRGHAEAGSVVKIYEGNTLLGSTTAKSDGSWSYTTPVRSEGKHTFTATATDAAGNVSGHSGNFVINIDVPDTVAPDAPVITGVYDDVGTQYGPVANGGKTDDSQPLISGTAEAGSIVTLKRLGPSYGNYVVGSAKADSNGHWAIQTQNNRGHLGNHGHYTYTATAKDAAGNISDASNHYVVDFVGSNQDDTTAPDAPVISNYYDDVGSSKGYDGNGGTTDDTTPTLNGHAEANSIVKVYEGSTLLGSTTAKADGSWSYTTPARTDGKHTFTATASDAAGNISPHSGNFVVNVDVPDWDFKETFNSQSQINFSNSAVYHLNYFDISVVNKGDNYYYSPGVNNKHYSVSKPVSSTAMVMGEGTTLKLDLKHPVTDISFKIGDLTTNEKLTVKYIDEHGSVIATQTHTRLEGLLTTASYHAPEAHEIASVQMSFTNPGYNTLSTYIWIDDVVGHSSNVSSQQLLMSTNQLMALPDESNDVIGHDVTLTTLHEAPQHGVVDLHDGSQNNLHLTLEDILSESHPNLFVQDGKQQLAVTGDKGDVVELKVDDLAHNTWQDAGQVTAGGIQYEVYQHTGGDVELLVQHGLELHQVA